MIVNVPECDRRSETEFIGGGSDNIAILAVQVADIMNIVPAGPIAEEPKLLKALVEKGIEGPVRLYLTACSYFWSWEFGQRMEVQPVENNADDPRCKLQLA